jgi:multiple sugar transport system substrate-binding protein
VAPLEACSKEFAAETGADVRWSVRTLQGFADASPLDLAREFDLVVFDHPQLGDALHHGAFLALDDLIPASSREDWQTNSVGPSFDSYRMNESLWAAPIDAAGTVAAYRPDRLSSLPLWSDVLDFAQAERGRVAVALLPLDALTAFFTLLANAGRPFFDNPERITDPLSGREALEFLRELTALSHQMSLRSSPIDILEAMSGSDEVLYSPLLFGYSNYCRPGFRRHLVKFGPFPTRVPGSVSGGILGGAGVAISAFSREPRLAAQFIDFVMSGDIQAGTYVEAGGQPGHRQAWLSPHANQLTGGYFRDTLEVLDGQVVRPRYHGYLRIQDEGGRMIHRFLSEGGEAGRLVESLDALYRDSLSGSGGQA